MKTRKRRPENKDPKTKTRKQRPENEDPAEISRMFTTKRHYGYWASVENLPLGRKLSSYYCITYILLIHSHTISLYIMIFMLISPHSAMNDMRLSKRHLVFLSLIWKFKAGKENEERKGGLRFRFFVFGSSFSCLRSSFSQQPRLGLETSASVSFRSGNKSPRLLSNGKIKGTTLPATLNALTAAGALSRILKISLCLTPDDFTCQWGTSWQWKG